MKIFTLKTLLMSALLCVGLSARAESVTGTIIFGTNNVKINGASVTGDDSQGNTWSITTVGTTSFTPQSSYSQVGSANKPATSITFTTILPESVNITAFSAKFGGFSGTAGTITLKVGDTNVGSGNLNGNNDVTISSTSAVTGTVLTVTVTSIAKGVACYNISYTYEENSSSAVATTTTIDASGITNTNIFTGTAAGKLTATVKAGENVIEGATVTWTSSNEDVATVSDGTVTLVDAGTTTITASYAGVEDEYQVSSATYELTVIYADPNAPGATAENPYTVAQAIENTPASGNSDEVYIKGIVSKFYKSSIMGDGANYRYYISDDGTTTANQLLVYKGKGLDNNAFSNANDLSLGDEVVIKGQLTTYNSVKEVAEDNYIVSRVTAPVITVTDNTVNLEYDATVGEIAYQIDNPIDGKALTATLQEGITWISNITVTGDKVTFTTSANEGSEDRTATITLQYERAVSKQVTVTQSKPNYATLPFNWEGGARTDFIALAGVTTYSLGDYAAQYEPYRVKLDGTGDYIQIKTDVQITKVTIGVKMIGGSNPSTITVQGSADGSTFTDVEDLTIRGSQNDEIDLETTVRFDASYRYVRLVFDKGSNVGVGPITINGAVTKTISNAGYATFCSNKALDFTGTGLTAYIATYTEGKVSFSEVTGTVPAQTGVLLKGDEGSYAIPVVASSNTDVAGNIFEGVTEDTEVDAGIFVLLNGAQGVGFYQTTNAFTVGANTAYISVPSGVKARFIGVEEDDDATAITAIEATEAVNNGVIYNLSGQRVVKPLKGIYIQNGKKFIVK